jgi:hypothetical protein
MWTMNLPPTYPGSQKIISSDKNSRAGLYKNVFASIKSTYINFAVT